MKRWEYLIADSAELPPRFLNELGSLGWELVSLSDRNGKAYFKRPRDMLESEFVNSMKENF